MENDSAKQVLRSVGDLLGARTTSGPGVRGEWAACRFRVTYSTGGGPDHFGRPEDRQYLVHVTRKWTDRRITIRRKKELTTRGQQERLEKRLEQLTTAQRSKVVDALVEFAGPFRLTRSAMHTRLPHGTSDTQLSQRVKAMAGYLEQLATAPLD